MLDNLNVNKQKAIAFSYYIRIFKSGHERLPPFLNTPAEYTEKIDGSSRPYRDMSHRGLSGSDELSRYPLTPSNQRVIG